MNDAPGAVGTIIALAIAVALAALALYGAAYVVGLGLVDAGL